MKLHEKIIASIIVFGLLYMAEAWIFILFSLHGGIWEIIHFASSLFIAYEAYERVFKRIK